MAGARLVLVLLATAGLVTSCHASDKSDPVPTDHSAGSPVQDGPKYSAVYDPEAIEAMIREVPEYPQWDYVWAHLQAINDQAELGPGIPLEAELSPTVNPEMAQVTIDAYSKAMGVWSFFGVDEVPAVWSLMSEQDYDWWYERVIAIEGDNPALDVWDNETNKMGHCSLNAYSFCGYGNPDRVSGVTFQYNIIGSKYEGAPNRNTVAHEAVHFYQDYYSQTYYEFMPCWFVEGQATLLGNVISGSFEQGPAPYGSSDLSRTGRALPGDETWTIEQWVTLLDGFLYDQEEMQRCTEQEINYTLGAVLFEYLYGHYSMWDIHQLMVMAAETEDWGKALEETLGITVDQLHVELATYVHGLLQDSATGN